jgi:hypothetical protein
LLGEMYRFGILVLLCVPMIEWKWNNEQIMDGKVVHAKPSSGTCGII